MQTNKSNPNSKAAILLGAILATTQGRHGVDAFQAIQHHPMESRIVGGTAA